MTKHPKRPRDPAQLAKLIVDIATGEVEDREPTLEELGKNPAASALGRKGGEASLELRPYRRRDVQKLHERLLREDGKNSISKRSIALASMASSSIF